MVTPYDLALSRSLLLLAHASGASRIVLGAEHVAFEQAPDFTIPVGEAPDPLLSALQFLPPLQMIAYYWTVQRGMNPDAPRP